MSELRNFDLNLLVAFDLLMQEQNVSRAAERMFVGQSAMSHILQRLRQQLDDPLLVSTSSGMKPTDRALALDRSGQGRPSRRQAPDQRPRRIRPGEEPAALCHRGD